MLKFGITQKKQLTSANLDAFHETQFKTHHLYGLFKNRKIVAIDLYDSLNDLSFTEIDELQERMLARFALHNGLLKYTHSQRFNDFDQLAMRHIRTQFPNSEIRVHDLGASDGRTSCDFYDALTALFGERLYFLSSDYAPCLYVLKRKNSANRLILDSNEHLLQIIVGPFVFNVVRPESVKLYPINHLIRYIAMFAYANPLLAAHKKGTPHIERRRLVLLCRKGREYINTRKNFHFKVYDVMSESTGRYDIIRAMNVLNYSYFTESELLRAIRNIFCALKNGGLFITGSNVERSTIVNGTIYKKSNDRMEAIAMSGKGSQVDSIIVAKCN